MEEHKYNSLVDELIQTGIINQGNEFKEDNFFQSQNREVEADSLFLEIPEDFQKKDEKTKKRLNEYDLNLYKNKIENDNLRSYHTVKRFLSLKENCILKNKNLSFEKFFYLFFPKIYKARIAKEALKKLGELNIDPKALLDKTIPYGEEEQRYKTLVKYLNFANEIQNNVKKKID